MSSIEDDLVVGSGRRSRRSAVKRETEKAHITRSQKKAEEVKPRIVPVQSSGRPGDRSPAPAPRAPLAEPRYAPVRPGPVAAEARARPGPFPSRPRRKEEAPGGGRSRCAGIAHLAPWRPGPRPAAAPGEEPGEEESRALRIHDSPPWRARLDHGGQAGQVIATCLALRIIANINRRLDKDAITAIMDEFGFEPDFIMEYGEEILAQHAEEETVGQFETKARAPIVTVMGHVDHVKTSLLDYIRKTKVIEGESGGITQHIGAYLVRLPQGDIAFLDTPGHEAFTAMRARGAQVTDIVVLVVAADTGDAATIEAINHARRRVPMSWRSTRSTSAANPTGSEGCPSRVLVEVGRQDGRGGDLRKFGQNVDRLLEMILLVRRCWTGEPARRAKGVVIESRREAGRGIVATVLIQNGTISIGQPFVCGSQYGKVRAMTDERGTRVKSAGPSTPVEILGWSGVPQAGDVLTVMKSEAEAREIGGRRSQIAREHEYRLSRQATSLVSIQDRIRRGELHDLNLVLKADVGGSIEVLRDTLQKLSTDEVKVRIIHEGVGLINESDILLAVAPALLHVL
jgi:translation initiation factor IF-2